MLDLIGLPYTSAARPGGIADAARVLRAAGLLERLAAVGDVQDAGDLDLPVGSGTRAPSGLLNEQALGSLVAATRAAVASSLARGRTPLLVGGDCPGLLGALAAGGDRAGDCGLLLVDGHEDAWPPGLSETGEASDSEVGIALGLVAERLPEPLDRLVPLLAPEAVAMLGPRDREEIERLGATSLHTTVGMFRDDEAIRAHGAAASAAEAVLTLSKAAPAYWLHVDLDVLATDDFPAADYLQPGGLRWDELLALSVAGFAAPTCLGASVAIYNPDLDPGRTAARRIVSFIADLVQGAATS